MRELVLMSHGNLASSYLDSLDMIAGGHDHVQAVTFDGEISKSELGERLTTVVSKGIETIIVVDLPGGTPCNVCLEQYASDENVTILASLNLPMILDLYLNLNNSNYLVNNALVAGRDNLYDVAQKLVANSETDDE